ncbi:MAG TPA: PEP-CTERM sorting domain-containing protein [Pirellulaceae bacterium]|nr:PEP-CTERM sorting domain-containing protein [Pirellulaceae bacterium]
MTVPRGSATKENPITFKVIDLKGAKPRERGVRINDLPALSTPAFKADKMAKALNRALGSGRAVAAGNVITITDFGGIKEVKDPTKEPGDGVRLIPGAKPPAPSEGSYGSPGSSNNTSSGQDPQGSQSEVNFGIEEIFIASYLPSPGESLDDIFTALWNQLNLNGIPTTYDSLERRLYFDNPVAPGQTMFFGNTDTGLDLRANFVSLVVPEPGSAVVLGALSILMLGRRKRR